MKITTTPKLLNSIFVVFLLSMSAAVQAAEMSYYFYVQFSDKNNSPYSLTNPAEFLSERAIARRLHYELICDSTDLPVNPSYLAQVENLGVPVHSRSKWMNGVTVLLADSGKMSLVRALPFVKKVQYTGKVDVAARLTNKRKRYKSISDYGTASTQITQLNGEFLHNQGFRGKGMQIAVLDAGFLNVNTNPAFDSLRLQNRILGTRNIINPASDVYVLDSHGAMVLSTMAANLPGQFLGTAPDASYWLIRTEYAPSEYLVETDFWVSGIEFADSVGVDVVSSSLGYTAFDDSDMNFKYADMNGKVSRASRAATMASKKGIAVVNSAGNEGNKSFHYIGSPADAEGIITVGAITTDSNYSSFSSVGPSFDGRVKPDVCALGTAAALINTSGVPSYGNGTSYAAPIMAGMMACFLQATKSFYPPYDMDTLLQAVKESGSLYASPTAEMGFGIPNFQTALAKLPFFTSLKKDKVKDVLLAMDDKNNTLKIQFLDSLNNKVNAIRIYSVAGNLMINQSVSESEILFHTDTFAPGIYAVCIFGEKLSSTHKVVIR